MTKKHWKLVTPEMLELFRWEAKKFHLKHKHLNESDLLSYSYECLCRLAVIFKPSHGGCFRNFAVQRLRFRLIDYLRIDSQYRIKAENGKKNAFKLVYDIPEVVCTETPEALYLAHEVAFNRSLARHKNGVMTRDALNYSRCFWLIHL